MCHGYFLIFSFLSPVLGMEEKEGRSPLTAVSPRTESFISRQKKRSLNKNIHKFFKSMAEVSESLSTLEQLRSDCYHYVLGKKPPYNVSYENFIVPQKNWNLRVIPAGSEEKALTHIQPKEICLFTVKGSNQLFCQGYGRTKIQVIWSKNQNGLDKTTFNKILNVVEKNSTFTEQDKAKLLEYLSLKRYTIPTLDVDLDTILDPTNDFKITQKLWDIEERININEENLLNLIKIQRFLKDFYRETPYKVAFKDSIRLCYSTLHKQYPENKEYNFQYALQCQLDHQHTKAWKHLEKCGGDFLSNRAMSDTWEREKALTNAILAGVDADVKVGEFAQHTFDQESLASFHLGLLLLASENPKESLGNVPPKSHPDIIFKAYERGSNPQEEKQESYLKVCKNCLQFLNERDLTNPTLAEPFINQLLASSRSSNFLDLRGEIFSLTGERISDKKIRNQLYLRAAQSFFKFEIPFSYLTTIKHFEKWDGEVIEGVINLALKSEKNSFIEDRIITHLGLFLATKKKYSTPVYPRILKYLTKNKMHIKADYFKTFFPISLHLDEKTSGKWAVAVTSLPIIFENTREEITKSKQEFIEKFIKMINEIIMSKTKSSRSPAKNLETYKSALIQGSFITPDQWEILIKTSDLAAKVEQLKKPWESIRLKISRDGKNPRNSREGEQLPESWEKESTFMDLEEFKSDIFYRFGLISIS